MRKSLAAIIAALLAATSAFGQAPLIFEGKIDLQRKPMDQGGRPQWAIGAKVGNTGRVRLYTYSGTNIFNPTSYYVTFNAGPSRDDAGHIEIGASTNATYVEFTFTTNALGYAFDKWYSSLKFVSGSTVVSTPEGNLSCSKAPEVDGGNILFTYTINGSLYSFTGDFSGWPFVTNGALSGMGDITGVYGAGRATGSFASGSATVTVSDASILAAAAPMTNTTIIRNAATGVTDSASFVGLSLSSHGLTLTDTVQSVTNGLISQTEARALTNGFWLTSDGIAYIGGQGFIKADGSVPFASDINMGSHEVTNSSGITFTDGTRFYSALGLPYYSDGISGDWLVRSSDLPAYTGSLVRVITAIPHGSTTNGASVTASGQGRQVDVYFKTNYATAETDPVFATGGVAVVDHNYLDAVTNVVGAGISAATRSGRVVTVTSTEADTLQTAVSRGSTSDKGIEFGSGPSPLTMTGIVIYAANDGLNIQGTMPAGKGIRVTGYTEDGVYVIVDALDAIFAVSKGDRGVSGIASNKHGGWFRAGYTGLYATATGDCSADFPKVVYVQGTNIGEAVASKASASLVAASNAYFTLQDQYQASTNAATTLALAGKFSQADADLTNAALWAAMGTGTGGTTNLYTGPGSTGLVWSAAGDEGFYLRRDGVWTNINASVTNETDPVWSAALAAGLISEWSSDGAHATNSDYADTAGWSLEAATASNSASATWSAESALASNAYTAGWAADAASATSAVYATTAGWAGQAASASNSTTAGWAASAATASNCLTVISHTHVRSNDVSFAIYPTNTTYTILPLWTGYGRTRTLKRLSCYTTASTATLEICEQATNVTVTGAATTNCTLSNIGTVNKGQTTFGDASIEGTSRLWIRAKWYGTTTKQINGTLIYTETQ